MRRRCAVALLMGTSACSLTVDLSGLSGGDAGKAVDARADARIDAGAETGADAGADAGLDAPFDGLGEGAPPSCPSPVSRVQAHYFSDLMTASNSIAVSTDTAQTGDYFVIGVNYGPSCGTVQQVGDSAGNAYASLILPDGDPDGGAGLLETWGGSYLVASDAGTLAVTVTFRTVCTGKNVKVVAYRGVDPTMPVGTIAFQHGGGQSTPNAVLTASAKDELFAHTADQTQAIDAGTGWTLIFKDAWGTIAEEESVPSAGLYEATYQPGVGENWGIQAVTLRCSP